MTFLPIVERELRVRARLRSTYRFRLFAAVGAIVLVGLLLLASETLASAGRHGATLFGALAWLSFGHCLLDGARNTADCLSEEKRAGTLGLLFLTDLRPYDVVLGKLMATSLNSFYGLLAIFPPLAIPLIIGGVTVGEFWRMVLVLLNTLFFSVAAGLAVSASSRDERRAWAATVAITVFFAGVPPLLLLSPAWSSSMLATFSPTTGFLHVFDQAYSAAPDRYWESFWHLQWISWGCLVAAMFVLPRAWQDRPENSGGAWWRQQPARSAQGVGVGAFERRSGILDCNPVVWLVARSRARQTFVWLLVGISAVIVTGAWGLTAGAQAMAATLFGVMLLVHLTLAVWVAAEACHLFSGARESGALELLLCTPLSAREVVEGHLLGLRRIFHRPVAVLLAVEVLLLAGQVYLLGRNGASLMLCLGVVGVVGLCLLGVVMDLHAVARYGMWQGLANQKTARAVTKTVMRVLVLPLAFSLCSGPFLPLIWVIKNLVFVNYAQEQLRRQFRSLLTDRFGWAEESEMVGQPTRRALRNPLPRVYPG
jgi:ABC-type transport system involved in multi-copper enzyme maturation permease subunit